MIHLNLADFPFEHSSFARVAIVNGFPPPHLLRRAPDAGASGKTADERSTVLLESLIYEYEWDFQMLTEEEC